MTPLKLVIIGLLLYVGYRLLTAGKKREKDKEINGAEKSPADSQPVSDVLVEDPVCHTLVPRQQAVRLKHHGEMIYFCSEACCNQYVQEKGEG